MPTVEEVMKNFGISRAKAQDFVNAGAEYRAQKPAPAPSSGLPDVHEVSRNFGVSQGTAQQFLDAGAEYRQANVGPKQGVTPAPIASVAPTGQSGFGLGGFQSAPKGGGSLTDFANALDQATSLAKQKRNALSLGIMTPSQGTVMASDFNSILSNINNAADNQATKLTDRAIEAATPQQFTYGTATDNTGNLYQVQYDAQGMMIGQQLLSAAVPQAGANKPLEVSPGATLFDTETGQPIYTAPTAAMQGGGGGGGVPNNKPSSKEITALKAALNNSKFQGAEADGKYADPNLYLQNYQTWIAAGLSEDEFFRNFPPSTFINPENTWLPPQIMKFAKKPASSSSSDDDYGDL